MKKLIFSIVIVCVLAFISLFLGFSSVTLNGLLAHDADSWFLIWQTRVPRTVALILAGAALALSGMIMQMLARNRFVEPSTAGTVESASLGLLFIMMFMPGIPVIAKMSIAALFAMAGSCLFMLLLRKIPLKSALMVPLTGIMLGYVIGSMTNFIAEEQAMLPSLQAYLFSSFSMVIKGKYELLWLSLPLTIIAYFAADRFTVMGLGETFTQNLGLNYRKVMILGLIIISLITALVVCTVGRIPFIGLVIPNIVSLMMGDNMRRTAPFVALFGAALLLLCDIGGRVISSSSEIPAGTMMGVVGAVIFLVLLLQGRKRFG